MISSGTCLAFHAGNSQTKKADNRINAKYQNEKIERCPTQEEISKNPDKYSNIQCIVSFNEHITEKKAELALDFSKKIKYLYKKQDIKALSNILPYPIRINNYKKSNITVKTKKDFLKLDKKLIMNKTIFNEIDKYPLFWNYQGFMLGDGQIWFFVNDEISDVVLNLE